MKRLIRLKETIKRTGRCRSTIYADPTFPKPVKIGPRAVAWVEEEIDQWIEEQIHRRNSSQEAA